MASFHPNQTLSRPRDRVAASRALPALASNDALVLRT